jgi:hypothetical protein
MKPASFHAGHAGERSAAGPFDTESATNEVPLEHHLADRLEEPGPGALRMRMAE